MIVREEIARRFSYHKPDTERAAKHDSLRGALQAAADIVVESTPPGREQSLAVTKLEEAMFWANAALARPKQEGPPV